MTRYNRLRILPRWKGRRRPRQQPAAKPSYALDAAYEAALARLDEEMRKMGFAPVWRDGESQPVAYIPWYRLN